MFLALKAVIAISFAIAIYALTLYASKIAKEVRKDNKA